MEPLHYILLTLPLLMVDWQTAFVWVGMLSAVVQIHTVDPMVSSSIITILQTYDYSGYEVWIIFLAIAIMRRFMFRAN